MSYCNGYKWACSFLFIFLKVWLCPVLFFFISSITNLSSPTGQITVSHGSKMVTDGIICVIKRIGIIPSYHSGNNGLSVHLYRWMVKSLEAFFKLIIFHGGCFCSMPHTLLLTLSLGLRQIGKEVRRTLENGNISVQEVSKTIITFFMSASGY